MKKIDQILKTFRMIAFRSMTRTDIPAALALCRAAGWNQLTRDWEIFLQVSPAGCCLATINDGIIGTVATIRYQKFFSWIGMVLVDPGNRAQGIGMQLLNEALHVLRNEETIKLDATPAGREMYLKLNFVDEYRISRMSTIVTTKSLEFSTALPLQQKDLTAVANFDREIFGADRKPILEWMLEGAPGYAFLLEAKSKLQGYCLGRHGHDFIQVGPVIAEDIGTAKKLVAAALLNCVGQPVILDAMQSEPEWKEWLCTIGFKEQRSLTRMYRGKNRFPGMREKQFAILGPEFG